MYEVTDQTRGHSVRSRDAILLGHLYLLWLCWGHVVTLTRLVDTLPGSPTVPVPRGSRGDGGSHAAHG